MGWLSWIGFVVGLGAFFVAWDLIFCGGRRCAQISDRMPVRFPFGRLMRVHDPLEDDRTLGASDGPGTEVPRPRPDRIP